MQTVIQETERAELASTPEETVSELLGNTPNPPPPPPSPVPAPQNMAAPIKYELLDQEDTMQPGHMFRQAGACSQGQYLPCQWPVPDAHTFAVGDPVAPQHTYNNAPMMRLGFTQNLHPVGRLNNGELLYEVPANIFPPPVCVAPPPNTFSSKKRKRASQKEDDRSYVKRPPNAFMLFLKEQRPKFAAVLNSKGSAAVNAVVGQKWNSMTEKEQAKYYEEANKERLLHSQNHPEWSSKDNYGKKRKRQRRAPTRTKASASAPAEETQQVKRLCVTAVQTASMEPSTSQTEVMELPHTQTMETAPVCDIAHSFHL